MRKIDEKQDKRYQGRGKELWEGKREGKKDWKRAGGKSRWETRKEKKDNKEVERKLGWVKWERKRKFEKVCGGGGGVNDKIERNIMTEVKSKEKLEWGKSENKNERGWEKNKWKTKKNIKQEEKRKFGGGGKLKKRENEIKEKISKKGKRKKKTWRKWE